MPAREKVKSENSATTALGVAAVIVAAILWGSTGTIQAVLPAGRDPLAVAWIRCFIGGLALLLFCLFHGPNRRAIPALPFRRIGAAALAIALYNIFFFSGVSMVGVGVGTAIALGSGPIWVSLYEALARRKRPSRKVLLGQAISILGVVALVSSNDLNGGSAYGYLFAALAGLSYAAYSLLTSRIGRSAPSGAVAAATFVAAAVIMLPVLPFASLAWLGAGSIAPLMFLGVAVTGIAFFLFTYGVGKMAASSAVTLTLAEPLTAWVLATVVVGEELSALKVLGAALLLAGLWIVTRSLFSLPLKTTLQG